MRKRFVVLFAIVAVALFGSVAQAATPGSQLDQSYTGPGNGTGTVGGGATRGQTFTAGISGQLTDIDLYFSNLDAAAPDLVVTLTSISGGLPDMSDVLATATVPSPGASASPVMLTATFSTPATVVAGTSYAFIVGTSGGYFGNLTIVTPGSSYPGGDFLITPTFPHGSIDARFATYVTVPSVIVTVAAEPGRAGYCSAAGNTWSNGSPIKPGTFLDLEAGAPDRSPQYKGATPANYLQGIGITCDGPPAGWARAGLFDELYPHYKHP